MATPKVVFHGTSEEAYALVASLDHNCTCVKEGDEPKVCLMHQGILYEQRFADGLLFARRISAKLIAEEWHE